MSSSTTKRLQRVHQAERARQRRQTLRLVLFGGVVILVLVAVAFLLGRVLTPADSGVTQTTSGKVINLQAAMDGFDIKEIHVKAGDKVTVNLRSLDNAMHTDGGGKHQFAIDELGVNLVAPPMSSNSTTFTATQPGEYTFYCDICCGGKANPTMNGKLIVDV